MRLNKTETTTRYLSSLVYFEYGSKIAEELELAIVEREGEYFVEETKGALFSEIEGIKSEIDSSYLKFKSENLAYDFAVKVLKKILGEKNIPTYEKYILSYGDFGLRNPPKRLPVGEIQSIENKMDIALMLVVVIAVGAYVIEGKTMVFLSMLVGGMIACLGVGMLFLKKLYKDAER